MSVIWLVNSLVLNDIISRVRAVVIYQLMGVDDACLHGFVQIL